MRMISRPAAPTANSPTALNWALPAKTSTESACVSTSERPALRAVTAYARPNGITPSQSGARAQKPRVNAALVPASAMPRSYGPGSGVPCEEVSEKVKRPRLRLPGAFRMGTLHGDDSWSS